MSTATPVAHWPREIENWLDGHGKGAWIAVMVLGFIVFWPVGLALLAYMIWGKQMFKGSCRKKSARSGRSSGNMAFDAYKADTLKRLEDEQAAFESFLERLRSAKDKAEFDAFMDENRRRRDEGAAQPERAEA
ncbi:MAG: DUF2852 domain-containing protein [Nocardiopsis sp. BM-2018]|nr:MAG: DUF2852 domain-containing protein [Nocardiopsis sp. BM-2018]